jgi:hypothetical protein
MEKSQQLEVLFALMTVRSVHHQRKPEGTLRDRQLVVDAVAVDQPTRMPRSTQQEEGTEQLPAVR